MDQVKAHRVIEGLLENAGITAKISDIFPCYAGGNNRVMEVSTDNGQYLAKWYFTGEHDQRDRLKSEWTFLQYASDLQLQNVPAAYSRDSQNHVALYEFIEGIKLGEGDITPHKIDQAAELLCTLNIFASNGWTGSIGSQLPEASEACFSVTDHFQVVDRRISRLIEMGTESSIDVQAEKFVIELKIRWEETKAIIKRKVSEIGIVPAEELARSHRCVSPSDFGFHNAICRNNGELIFIDFEYAGWDDPAKMIGDFFFQPAVPVSWKYYESFANKVLENHRDSEMLKKRTDILRPVFGFKWCCIMLNIFIHEWAERRLFANPKLDLEKMKLEQLLKAKRLLGSLETLTLPNRHH